jgi:carbon-monoxide dehydrogenase medium subunit
MYAFDYQRPTTVRAVASALARAEDAKLLAGGHTLLPTMKLRLASPQTLIDLGKVEGLAGIEVKGRAVVIGAMTRHAEVASSASVEEAIPALATLAGRIGDPAVRARGTIGGSVANNDPAADYPAACLALGATIITNKRKIAADDFFTGMFDTALEEGELITKISFPIPSKAAYEKFRNPASRYALVGVFVAKRGREARVAVTGAGSNGVFRHTKAEEALSARFSPKALDGVEISSKSLNGDIHASAEYRAHLIGVLTRRAVAAATRGGIVSTLKQVVGLSSAT